MNNEPLVSVVIPAYNRKDLLEIAIKSVLSQTYNNYEILIIDDGSSEDLKKLKCIQDSRVRYYRNDNHGVAFSRNFGMKNANGKYVAFLDSDDFWKPNKLEIQVLQMEKKNAVWSQHSYYYYDDETKTVSGKIDTSIYKNNLSRFLFCSFKVQTSCFMVKRDVVIESGIGFDETKTFGEDAEFFLAMMKKYPLLCIEDYLGYFRIKKTNAGFDVKKQIISRAVIWDEHNSDSFFRANTSAFVRIAYKYCYFIVKKNNIKSIFLLKILYTFPWVIFKIESKRLIRNK